MTAETPVHATEPTTGDTSYPGFTLAYQASTGTLLHTCLGAFCESIR